MREQNLTQFGKDVSPDRQRELSRKGGKASGESKKRKKQIREILSIIGQTPADKTAVKKLEKAGISEEATQLVQIGYNLMQRAKRSDKAAALVAELMGELPKDIARNDQLKIDRERLKLEREKLRPTGEPNEDIQSLMELLQKGMETVKVLGFNGEEIELTGADVRYLESRGKIKDGRFIDPEGGEDGKNDQL